jgi:hypothetical protein
MLAVLLEVEKMLLTISRESVMNLQVRELHLLTPFVPPPWVREMVIWGIHGSRAVHSPITLAYFAVHGF